MKCPPLGEDYQATQDVPRRGSWGSGQKRQVWSSRIGADWHRLQVFLGVIGSAFCLAISPAWSATNVYLTGVPDYDWYYGCMGTAAGNLTGFWDRHGFTNFYTGHVNGGLAPLNTAGGNVGIISMWASKAGLDGRPANEPGHVDDYYDTFEDTGRDPYILAGRTEHTPDCIGDFIGLSQLKWTNMANECSGNIDGFCFVYWDTNGARRINYTPDGTAGEPARDVQSGLRAWTEWRGYEATVFTQLTDFNPTKPTDKGFTFADLKAEIDSGYPVLLFLQNFTQLFRSTSSGLKVNPPIHAMLAYGYYLNNGIPYVRYRTSWAGGDNRLHRWNAQAWEQAYPVRGVIGYHPLPKITQCSLIQGDLALQWDGPAAELYDSTLGTTRRVHGYVVEMASTLPSLDFVPVSPVLTTNSYTVSNSSNPAYFRIRLVQP